MDYSNDSGIEERVVKDSEHHGQQVRVVSGVRTYQAQIKELWDVVTNAEVLPNWFCQVSGDLSLAGRYQLKGNAGGEIIRCEAPTAFDITWEMGGNVSWVTVRLESVADGVRFELEHLMGKDEASEKHWNKYGPGATGVGWDFGFLSLGLYLKNQTPVVESETNAWCATSDGKTFIRNCARAWKEAHILNGEDPQIAESMASATAAFYCGE